MRSRISLAVIAVLLAAPLVGSRALPRESPALPEVPPTSDEVAAQRREADFDAMRAFRPGYPFWQHVFTMRDGAIAFGSAVDGRLLATFPAKGAWTPRNVVWADPDLARLLDGQRFARRMRDRREQVEALFERAVGPVLQNSTRGDALRLNARRYGQFVGEWGAIYERFGVPADIGLAQVVLESGLSPARRSAANAIGFCQWLQRNWKRLNALSPTPIDGRNQTTQAPYCAAYLSVLATKYGSFIPALSEHNAGGTNVGRTLINGEHLGATDVRAQYLLGSQFARDLRALPGRDYAHVYGSYGPRSYLYAEMVFGNTLIVRDLLASIPQVPIYAMRTPRALTMRDITARTGLSADEVRRFNPSLVTSLASESLLYLPFHVSDFGPDVAFWRRPPEPAYVAVLNDFMRLEAGPELWDDPAFADVLATFRRRFAATRTEEGDIMDTVLGYVMDQAYTSPRRSLLADFRSDEQVRRLVDRGRLELDVVGETRCREDLAETRAGCDPRPQ